MTEFLPDYGLFLAKTLTFVVAFIVVVAFVAASAIRNRPEDKGSIRASRINDHFKDMQWTLQAITLPESELKQIEKQEKKSIKAREKDTERRKRVYVIDFKGDIKAHGVESLRHEVTAILSVATAEDEVVITLESPGGHVHLYGLAASQLERIRAKGIPLTACVDKVAASGGYMMACVANTIVAAPFAVLGSIGVVAELPNFNRVIRKYDVDYNVYTAGEYKRTVSMLAENTEEGVRKFREELNETHELFKTLVRKHRPSMDTDAIATGEHWYGSVCLDKGIIDRLGTSDDYLMSLHETTDLIEVKFEMRKSMAERLGIATDTLLDRALDRLAERSSLSRKF